MDVPRLRRSLLRWFHRSKRPLPWRVSRDPYRIWVSEIMLQQTTVAAVIPFYERFIKRFPTVLDLAASNEDDVLALWSGLGYYSRARNLRAGAQNVVKDHGGAFPREPKLAITIKGVGRYTANAVTSMAYGAKAAVVDGNVRRVVSRLFAEKPANEDRAQALADTLLSIRSPGFWNEAMMELGATICTPRNPRCDICPISADCAGKDRPEHWSEGKPRRAAIETNVQMALVESRGRILLQRNPAGRRLMGGLFDLPNTGIPGSTESVDLECAFPEINVASEPALTLRHTVTHHRIRASVHRGRLRTDARTNSAAFHAIHSLPELPLGGLTLKALRRLGQLKREET